MTARYGHDAIGRLSRENGNGFDAIPGTTSLWAELRLSAREGAVHLDDLLLRRTRVGLLCERGGQAFHDRLKAIIRPAMGWSEETWTREWDRYVAVWRSLHSPQRLGNAG